MQPVSKVPTAFGILKEHFDFVFLDEVQDVSMKVILDLELIQKYGFIAFGDNAQNITAGVSLKFSDLVARLDQIDGLVEDVEMSRRLKQRNIWETERKIELQKKKKEAIQRSKKKNKKQLLILYEKSLHKRQGVDTKKVNKNALD